MERNEKSMKNISLALAFDYLEEVNYALVQSKMDICNWCIIENNSEVDLENILLEISGEYVETIHIHQEESEPLTWKQGAAYAWALGILIMGAGSILSYRKLKIQVREACITGDGCWECAGLDTAFVLGFFPPKIYLPMNLPEGTISSRLSRARKKLEVLLKEEATGV